MPQVGNKKFPYTKQGIARATQLREKLRNPAARPPMPSGPGRPQVTLPNGMNAPARTPGRGPLKLPPSRRPLPNKEGVTPAIPERTPPQFGRPALPGPIKLPPRTPPGGSGGPIRKPKPPFGGVRPGRPIQGRPKPGRPGRPGFGIRPFPQNYRPIRKKMI